MHLRNALCDGLLLLLQKPARRCATSNSSVLGGHASTASGYAIAASVAVCPEPMELPFWIIHSVGYWASTEQLVSMMSTSHPCVRSITVLAACVEVERSAHANDIFAAAAVRP
mmetsp:Transcript_5462/g.9149  ORF Transcript_5462/g.9149 Transcript_5462/m.9149 type:complete len:113 (-) Transcript_5462:54-392(-)